MWLLPVLLLFQSVVNDFGDDRARLQGAWVTRVRADHVITITIKGDQTTILDIRPPNHIIERSAQIRLDESTTPKRLDWIGFKHFDGRVEPLLPAIFEVDDDTLTIRTGSDGLRPAEFVMIAGRSGMVKLTRKLGPELSDDDPERR